MSATANTRRDLLKGGALSLLLGVSPRLRAADTPAPEAIERLRSDLAATARVLALDYTEAERAQLARTYDDVFEVLRRVRRIALPRESPPALRFDPRLPGKRYPTAPAGTRGNPPQAGKLPGSEHEVALAPAWRQAAWLRSKALSSVELTKLYLQRIERIGPKLENFITVTADLALEQAARADDDLAHGRVRSALHGVPYGLKDLFDVAGVRSTWGAEPFQNQVASANAAIVDRLAAAGAVLLGKTAVGAIAYGDIWYGGIARNPWNPEEGSSGSSAGSASATAAGLVGFSIGTETLGSIVSPSNRCGTTGLRPTFGRIARRGAMPLCWSWDKVGPIARCPADCALVLEILNGADPQDWSSLDVPFGWDWQAGAASLRVGYVPASFAASGATDVDRRALEAVRRTGATVSEVNVPDLPYEALNTLVFVEAAACFSDMTLDDLDDRLKWQDDRAWPNTWRQARLFPAVELVQLERLRREVMLAFDRIFSDVDVLVGPNFVGGMLSASNGAGHPCLALKSGFIEAPTRTPFDEPVEPQGRKHRVPRTISLWASLFREDHLVTMGRALEPLLGVADEHPAIART